MNPEISIIMPYWERAEALIVGLNRLISLYPRVPLIEVIIADDGSPTEPAYDAIEKMEFPFPIQIEQLPEKSEQKNPCVPINKAVALSKAPVLFLTNPECVHVSAILGPALEAHQRAGPNSVVVCGVFDEGGNKWFSHSVEAPYHYHFANLLSRQLFDAAGGFDEDYRDGYCYDDPDFVMRLEKAGAKWIERDDLMVRHINAGPKAKVLNQTTRNNWHRNLELYIHKWGGPPKSF